MTLVYCWRNAVALQLPEDLRESFFEGQGGELGCNIGVLEDKRRN
jgi:hypothetical protein